MIAWAVLLSGVLVYMGKTFGWLPHNALTHNAFQIGSLLEMMLLSLALAHRVRELSHQSRTDALTQLVNRRAFDETVEREFDRRRKSQGVIALLVADVDHFKQVNDRHGHAYGDKVLRRIADVLRECVDGRDLVGRYGGEEFAILFPGLDAPAAAARAEQIRRTVQERVGDHSPVTISIGVAATDDGDIDSPNALFRAADEALYRAKDQGRNRVVGYAEAPESLPAG
jgi:diguanylate cyclase (GGDEF)-like protein